MVRITKTVFSIFCGILLWGLLWNGGTRATLALFPNLVQADQPITHAGILVTYILYSVFLSMAAGYVTALVAGISAVPAVWTLAAIQLGLGIVFEVSYWSLMPSWYHVIFLALVIPATVFGGRLRTGPGRAPTMATEAG